MNVFCSSCRHHSGEPAAKLDREPSQSIVGVQSSHILTKGAIDDRTTKYDRHTEMRDGFTKDTRDTLALRVAVKCSLCARPTSGPADDPTDRVLIGVAAHICAASPGGPRFDPNQTIEERRSIENGIWLCANCAKLIDDDVVRFSVSELHRIKRDAEARARQELVLPPSPPQTEDWTVLQLSKVSSYEIPIRFPGSDAGVVDLQTFEKFSDRMHQFLAYALGHTCITTPFDDFVYLLSLERDNRKSEHGYLPFTLSLHCHITAFVWAFQEWMQFFVEGSTTEVSRRVRSLPGDQTLHIHPQFGKLVPHRISRSGASSITIQELAGRPIPMDRGANTSTLLRILAVVLNSQVVVWDGADASPDLEKVLEMGASINDAGRFSWDQIHIDRQNPETWEFVGDR